MNSLSLLLTFASVAFSQQSKISAQDGTAFALKYGYPLLGFETLAQPLIQSKGVNNVFHKREPPNADFRDVVRPNVDTIYSTAIYDLSHSDVVINIPFVPADQYALFSFYDPYGNNFASTRAESEDSSGLHKLTLREDRETPGVNTNGDSVYQATIDSPTTYGILLVRWLLNSTNLNDIHDYQDNTYVHGLHNSRAREASPYLSDLPKPGSYASPAENVLKLVAAFAAIDEPFVASDSEYVNSHLAAAGISEGSWTPLDDVDIAQANFSAKASSIRAASDEAVVLNNGWSQPSPDLMGLYENNYAFRTAVASVGYLALQKEFALYPSWVNGSGVALTGNAFHLGPDESLLYTFSGKPPLNANGFWSITGYEGDYLIPNPQNVYALGDRSNITYPDGSRVYSSDAQSRNNNSMSNEQFQILIQPADLVPPANWTSNWLPGPVGGGDMSALLRWYSAQESLVNGSYAYPVVTRQSAFRNKNSTGTSGNGTVITTGANSTSTCNGSANTGCPYATATSPAPYTGLAAQSYPPLLSRSALIAALVFYTAL
ncbi:hypothetical protein KC332_g233 [Hortaea werneckii]|uniref:DUF1254 domain-containing protein n=2 Tax=Hortaea werneckii TaxID=91943 RepID=A0A3M7J2K0_HORWE|nr:hypothetical protein KC358_g240 [Hortaea werneckii]OTA37419.1 hypothetical protein BTJ68_02258 [Hortaea werneckii EXF-2000]KAI6853026.1 hypothetical protein KC350_g358 [Hortaea werneckii]KAI6911675.1 hypothetical protein KC348_g12887 [Hortaea werneckii]KAI6944926.1 hypothetical protein KC341_g479 [Hortaea werneckii]